MNVPRAQPRPAPARLPLLLAGALAAAAFLATFLAPVGAGAHPFALSAFDAFTDGRDIRFDFKLDATSVADLITRSRGGQPPASTAEIPAHQDLLLDYFARRFRLTNTDLPCELGRPTGVTLNEAIAKVVFQARFRCPTDLGLLTIDSTLFHDEATPHDMVGNFHHRRALERYFFSRTSHQVRVDVPNLAQVLPAEIDDTRQFRTATPPPGAFDESARRSAAALDKVMQRPGTPAGPGARGFWYFLGQGILHILGGLDHVLFVVSLILAMRRPREMLVIVTSFTVAHSITLVLASLGLVYMSPRLAEPLIALSIIYVAAENILRRDRPARPQVAFAFGLFHGFGFSAVLRDLGFGGADLATLLVGFNLGVEIGQLIIVLPLFPLVLWLRRRDATYTQISRYANAAVGLVACWWFIERLISVR
jgi:hydrogenase/urease accessory protein HupE